MKTILFLLLSMVTLCFVTTYEWEENLFTNDNYLRAAQRVSHQHALKTSISEFDNKNPVEIIKQEALKGNAIAEYYIKNSNYLPYDAIALMKMGLYQNTNRELKSSDDSLPNLDYNFITLMKPELPLDAHAQKLSLEKYYLFEDKFMPFAQSLEKLWNEMSDLRASQNIKYKKNEKHNEKGEYIPIRDALLKKYYKYMINSNKYKDTLNNELKKSEIYYKDLKKYFMYRHRSEAQKQYKSAMEKNFGHYIEPSRWCLGNTCPSISSIEQVITQKAEKKWYEKSEGLPPQLTFVQFASHATIRKALREELQKKFNSHKELKELHIEKGLDAYREWRNELIISNSFEEIDRHLKEFEAYKFISLEALLRATSWKDFIYSPSITNELYKICANEILAKKIQEALSDKENNIKNIYYIYMDVKSQSSMFEKSREYMVYYCRFLTNYIKLSLKN